MSEEKKTSADLPHKPKETSFLEGYEGLADAMLVGLYGFGGVPEKHKELYQEFDLEPKRENGHLLAIHLAEKYHPSYKIKKKRGRKKTWDTARFAQFHWLVTIKRNEKDKRTLRESIALAARELKIIKDRNKKSTEVAKTRYYEARRNERVVKHEEFFKRIEESLNSPERREEYLSALKKLYEEEYQ